MNKSMKQYPHFTKLSFISKFNPLDVVIMIVENIVKLPLTFPLVVRTLELARSFFVNFLPKLLPHKSYLLIQYYYCEDEIQSHTLKQILVGT